MKLSEIKQLDEGIKLQKLAATVLTTLALGGCAAVPVDRIFDQEPIETTANEPATGPTGKQTPSADVVNNARWAKYCRDYADSCGPFSGKSSIPVDVADKVNNEVNRKMVYDYDSVDQTGGWHAWHNGESGKGICVEFSLAKRDALRKMGYSSDSMSILIVKNGKHMVLLVYTNKGPVVLDNLQQNLIRPARYNNNTTAMEINGQWFDIEQKDAKPAN